MAASQSKSMYPSASMPISKQSGWPSSMSLNLAAAASLFTSYFDAATTASAMCSASGPATLCTSVRKTRARSSRVWSLRLWKLCMCWLSSRSSASQPLPRTCFHAAAVSIAGTPADSKKRLKLREKRSSITVANSSSFTSVLVPALNSIMTARSLRSPRRVISDSPFSACSSPSRLSWPSPSLSSELNNPFQIKTEGVDEDSPSASALVLACV
mmetsp:Transcript_44101/g.104426  ORF Transcript_44101/g.104426 Transcript_44101/m.104426 type:complete len:213 (-) Transcript_44101:205-843(-)